MFEYFAASNNVRKQPFHICPKYNGNYSQLHHINSMLLMMCRCLFFFNFFVLHSVWQWSRENLILFSKLIDLMLTNIKFYIKRIVQRPTSIKKIYDFRFYKLLFYEQNKCSREFWVYSINILCLVSRILCLFFLLKKINKKICAYSIDSVPLLQSSISSCCA